MEKQLYYNQSNKDKTLNLWKKIAEHFKGNPAVATYDILNEPGIKANATYSFTLGFFYNEIYNTIRSKDSNHIIIMESCWDADNLPRPSQYGWKNVAYEYHYYPWNAQNSSDAQKSYFSSKVSDIAKSQLWSANICRRVYMLRTGRRLEESNVNFQRSGMALDNMVIQSYRKQLMGYL